MISDVRWLAVVAWAGVLVAVAVVVTAARPGKLYPTFVAAGEHFRNGEPMYAAVSEGQDQYRYSPVAAAAFAPWSYLPTSVGAVFWRLLQAAALLLALRTWSRVAVPKVSWPVLALLCLPLVAGNVFNGQLNPLVAALMLAGVAAFARERFSLAACAVAGAAMLKIYPLALGLLLCVVEPRRFTPRLILAIALGCLLPFAFQSERYVAEQFAGWVDRIGTDDRTDQAMHKGYHDFQKLARRWGIDMDLPAYRVIEVIAGCAAAGFVWSLRKRRDVQIHACAGLSFVWCTLFGPATESATYMLLAPVAVHAFVATAGRPWWERLWTRGAYLLLLSVPIALWFPRAVSDPYRALIPQAHGAVLLLAWVVWQCSIRRADRPACEAPDRSIASPVPHHA